LRKQDHAYTSPCPGNLKTQK